MKNQKEKWYKNAYYRNVVDMHIEDWDKRFMSEFSAENYVEMLLLSKVDSAVVYAHSHVGHCYYSTKIGHMHEGLKGRDIFREVLELCHKKNIKVVAYYSLIFNSWAYNNHSDWRIIDADGKGMDEKSRYGICCPNSPYKEHVVAQIEEICQNYEFEGIRFDMTFWPSVCYCAYCQKRYASEIGQALPRVVNWEDPTWVTFQRRREAWLVDFAALATSTVKNIKSGVSVEHQASTYTAPWQFGVTTELSKQNDFLQGDFYGGPLQGSFACKLLYNLSENIPFAFETSSNLSLNDHTTLKTEELLKTKAYAAIANGGAFVFIDAIDPVGTLNKKVYETMGGIFGETKVYENYLDGRPCQDVGIYLSTKSKFDLKDNGKKVTEASSKTPHIDAALNAAKSLIVGNVLFGVITRKNLKELFRYQTVILPNILMMDEEEADAFRNYVYAGGSLYASRYTSLLTKDGVKQKDFILSDVFGVSWAGETDEDYTYVAPTAKAKELLAGYSEKYPMSIYGSQVKVQATKDAQVFGKIVLPYTNPADLTKYASIHSNPPGIPTEYPAIILNRFGKGNVIYVAGDLENMECHREIFLNLLKTLPKAPFLLESDAPTPVEITVFHQEKKRRYIIKLLNFPNEFPAIPVEKIKIKMRLGDKSPKSLLKLPEREKVSFKKGDGAIEFNLPRLKTFLMLALDY